MEIHGCKPKFLIMEFLYREENEKQTQIFLKGRFKRFDIVHITTLDAP